MSERLTAAEIIDGSTRPYLDSRAYDISGEVLEQLALHGYRIVPVSPPASAERAGLIRAQAIAQLDRIVAFSDSTDRALVMLAVKEVANMLRVSS